MKPSHRKPRLLIITDYYYPHWTGIAKSIWYLTQHLVDYDVTVLTTKHAALLPSFEVINNTRIIRCNPTFRFSRTFISFSFIPQFIRLVFKSDCVFLNSPCTYMMPVSLIAKLLRKKVVIFHHGDLILPRSLLNAAVEKIFDVSSYVSFLLANKVASYTRDYATYSRVLRPFLKKFSPLLIPLPKLKVAKTTSLLPLQKLKKTKVLIGFAGRFVEEKGFDILFKAIPQVVASLPKAHFVFAGETLMGYENFFERKRKQFEKVKQNITLLGLLDDNEMPNFYQYMDLFVASSRSDCFNLAQAESMLLKTPVVVTDIPGLRTAVKQTGFGSLFQKNNPQDLAQTIVNTIKRRKSILKNYARVLDFFDTGKALAGWKTFL